MAREMEMERQRGDRREIGDRERDREARETGERERESERVREREREIVMNVSAALQGVQCSGSCFPSNTKSAVCLHGTGHRLERPFHTSPETAVCAGIPCTYSVSTANRYTSSFSLSGP